MKNFLSKSRWFFGVAVMGRALPVMAATSISGQIEFIGGASLNGPLDTATAFTGFFGPGGTGGPQVLFGSTGTYSSVAAGTEVSFSLFTFNPAPSTTPWNLWSFSSGGTTFSFDVTSLTIAAQNPYFLDLQGTGIAHATGFADTMGTWTITDTGATPTFTFGALTMVPEPSVAALLLLGLSGVVLRKSRRS